MNNPVCPTCLSDNKVPEWNNMFKDLEMQMNDVVEQVCGIRNDLFCRLEEVQQICGVSPIEEYTPLMIASLKLTRSGRYIMFSFTPVRGFPRIGDYFVDKYVMTKSSEIGARHLLGRHCPSNEDSEQVFWEFVQDLITLGLHVHHENIARSRRNANRKAAAVQFLSSLGAHSSVIARELDVLFAPYHENNAETIVDAIRNKYRRLVSEIRCHLERAEFHAWKKEQRKENTNG